MTMSNDVVNARLLGALLTAAPGSFGKIRKRLISRSSAVDPARLEVVQAVLQRLVEAVHADDEGEWAKVERAAAALGTAPRFEPVAEPPLAAAVVTPSSVAATPAPQAAAAKLEPLHAAPPIAPKGEPSPWVSRTEQSTSRAASPAAAVGSADAPPLPSAEFPPATPFREGPAIPPPASVDEGMLPPAESGTANLSAEHLGAHDDAANPFEQSKTGVIPQLTVQQYAQFWARVTERPEDIEGIYRKFRVADAATHRLLDAEWQQRLGADATQRQLFDMLYARLREQLRKERG